MTPKPTPADLSDPQARAWWASLVAQRVADLALLFEQIVAGLPADHLAEWAELSAAEQTTRREDAESYLIQRIGHLNYQIGRRVWADVRSSLDLRHCALGEEQLVYQAVQAVPDWRDREAQIVWRQEMDRLRGLPVEWDEDEIDALSADGPDGVR
jgi:hypothetical protein